MRRVGLVACGAVVALVATGRAALVGCASDDGAVAEAIDRLRTAVDPCGESADVAAVLDDLVHCERASYRICIDRAAPRNLFERPTSAQPLGTITWNPNLRSALVPGPAVRDPTASLLHELVHAAHDCAGLDAGALELEAVRVENVYRRAAGLAQRTGYGDDALPVALGPGVDGACVRTTRSSSGALTATAGGSDVAADGPAHR